MKDKARQNRTRSESSEVPRAPDGSAAAFRIVDRRPEAVAQRRLRDMANSNRHLRPSGGPVTQLFEIKGHSKSYGNVQTFKKEPVYKNLMKKPEMKAFDEDTIEFHLNQYCSRNDLTFRSEAHFHEALLYDLRNKTASEHGALTLQEWYMTRFGWKSRGDKKLEPAPGGALKVYRVMKVTAWEALQAKTGTLTNHLGDYKQTLRYLYGSSDKAKVLVEFELKPGAERTLFGTKLLALPAKPSGDVKTMVDVLTASPSEDTSGSGKPGKGKAGKVRGAPKAKPGKSFAVTKGGEGKSSGKVGIKAESKGDSGFSFVISDPEAAADFMKLVQEARPLLWATPREKEEGGGVEVSKTPPAAKPKLKPKLADKSNAGAETKDPKPQVESKVEVTTDATSEALATALQELGNKQEGQPDTTRDEEIAEGVRWDEKQQEGAAPEAEAEDSSGLDVKDTTPPTDPGKPAVATDLSRKQKRAAKKRAKKEAKKEAEKEAGGGLEAA